MKLITFDDIKEVNISPLDCYGWASDMILHKKESCLPPKTHMTIGDSSFCNVMPCIIPYGEGSIGGIKIVTRYPDRTPALDSKILIFNAESGELLALMDGNWITAMRTGAVAVHSIAHLAKCDFNTIGIIGLGNVARACLIVLAAKYSDRCFDIKLLNYKDQAGLFADRFKDYPNIRFHYADSVKECIQGSDVVISCATYLEHDIAENEWFDEGVLVVPVHTRGFMNCDLFFDKVFADDTAHVDHFKYFSQFKYYAEVFDVVTGKALGRSNNKERILAYNIGISIHDIGYAAHIFEFFKDRPELFDKLSDIDLREPVDKFWV